MAYRYNPITGKLDYFDNPTSGSLVIGVGAAGVDYTLTFDGESSNGVVTWMEDEDYFLFNDTIFMFDAKPIYFRSTQSYIYSENAGIITLFGATNIDLVSNAIVIGKNTDEDISFTFNAASNDGVLTWMEDEDYFKFSDDVMIPAGENIFLVDTNTYIRHDGTNLILADDAKINLFSNAITFGTTVDSDITLTFQANSNTGIFKWMEDEDYFEFSDDINMGGATNFLKIVDDTGQISWGGTYLKKLTLRPILTQTTAKASGTPTQVSRGLNIGYSLPIWNSDNEELYWRMRIPVRWDGSTDPQFGICVTLVGLEDVGDKFKFQLEWQCTGESSAMGTATSNCVSEQTVLAGRNAANNVYFVFFTFNADDGTNPLLAGNMIQARLRRIAASSNEASGEIVVWDWATMWPVDKVYGIWSLEANDT